MISALQQEQVPVFGREELGEVQTQMLILAGEAAARGDRVELIAQMALQHARMDEKVHPLYEKQKFIFDAFANDHTFGSFRYELADILSGRVGSELEVRHFRLTEADIQEDTKEYLGVDDEPQKVLDMLRRAIEISADTAGWMWRDGEEEVNPVLGRSYSKDSTLLRPAALLPVVGQLMVIGGNMLEAAGGDSAAQADINVNIGKHFYGGHYPETQQIILWARNAEDIDVQFAFSVKPFGGGSENPPTWPDASHTLGFLNIAESSPT